MSSEKYEMSSDEACIPAADGPLRNEDFVAMPMTFAVQKKEEYIIPEEILLIFIEEWILWHECLQIDVKICPLWLCQLFKLQPYSIPLSLQEIR